MDSRLNINVQGTVQGVFFRAGAQEQAKKLGLVGYATNLGNGSVEIVAEGEQEQLEELLMWCWKGPKGAKVTDLEFAWGLTTGEFEEFEVIRD